MSNYSLRHSPRSGTWAEVYVEVESVNFGGTHSYVRDVEVTPGPQSVSWGYRGQVVIKAGYDHMAGRRWRSPFFGCNAEFALITEDIDKIIALMLDAPWSPCDFEPV